MKKNTTALIFTLVFAAISLCLIRYHEMWRDELQAWLLARDSASVPELFANLKYEGHPGLWHLMLYPLTRIFETPVVMQYFHVVIATTSVFILVRWSPFTPLQKILLCFSYFLFYEYAMISRNYAIGVLLIFLICAVFPKRRAYPLIVASALFLLSHTSVLGLIFALSLFAAIWIEEVVVSDRTVKSQDLTALNLSAISIALFGFITAIVQIIPPSDSGIATAWRLYPSWDILELIYYALIGAYFPLPNFSLSFWNSRLLLSNITLAVPSLTILVVLIYAVCGRLASKPTALFLYVSASSALILFFYTKYPGSIRHHGFLFIALVAALWIYDCCDAKNLPSVSRQRRPISVRLFNPLLSLMLSVHVLAGLTASFFDFKYPFSAANETARFLERNGLADQTIIGHTSSATSAVVGYMNEKSFFYADADRYGTFVRFDNLRSNKVDFDHLSNRSTKLASREKEIILVLNSQIEDFEDAGFRFEKLFESSQSIVRDEKFYVYRFISDVKKPD